MLGSAKVRAKPKPGHESENQPSISDLELEPISISNDRQAGKAMHSILSAYQRSTEWDARLDSLKHALAVIKGGATNFPSFGSRIEQITPLLSECVLSLRSSLVKCGCLIVTELSERMAAHYSVAVLPLIPTLFRLTQNGAQIIAGSCRSAILSIGKNIPSKRVLDSIIEVHASKSFVQRQIVANSVLLIATHWGKDKLREYFPQIKKVVVGLLSDSTPETRQWARDSIRKLAEIFPEKSEGLLEKLDSRARTSLQSERTLKPSRRAPSLDSAIRRGKVSRKITFSELTAVDESKYLSELHQLLLQGETDEIIGNAESISQHLLSVMTEGDPLVLGRALEITADLVGLIPDAFEKYLEPLFQIVFKQRSQAVAHRFADRLAESYPPSEIFQAVLTNPDSMRLFDFVNMLIRKDPDLLTCDVAGRILSLCLCTCLDKRRDLGSVRYAVSLITLIHDEFHIVYHEFLASAKDDARLFLSKLQLPEPRPQPSRYSSFTEEVLSVPPSIPHRESPQTSTFSVAPQKSTFSRVPPDFSQTSTFSRPPPPSDVPGDLLVRVQQSVALAETASLERLIERLESDDDKAPVIRLLSAYLSANEGIGLPLVLPVLSLFGEKKNKNERKLERELLWHFSKGSN
jgi:hypothetical protein